MALRSDQWFMREVFVHHSLLRALFARRRQPSDVDDLCQETYLRILSAYAHHQPALPRGMIVRIARNLLIDLVRRERRESVRALRFESATENRRRELDPERHLSAARELNAFKAAVATLPARPRQVLWMRRVNDLPVKTIARQLEIAPHTVEQHIRKALRRTRAQMAA